MTVRVEGTEKGRGIEIDDGVLSGERRVCERATVR